MLRIYYRYALLLCFKFYAYKNVRYFFILAEKIILWKIQRKFKSVLQYRRIYNKDLYKNKNKLIKLLVLDYKNYVI